MYKDYANTVDWAVKFLKEMNEKKSRPKLIAWLAEKREDPKCRGLDFPSYLTSPVKRNFLFATFSLVRNSQVLASAW